MMSDLPVASYPDEPKSEPARFSSVLWAQTAVPKQNYPRLDGAENADVVIVGGGYTGLSAALHLASTRSVILIESCEAGFGASGRNAAGYVPGYLDHTPDTVVRTLGQERGDRLNTMVAGSTRVMMEIIAKHGIDAGLQADGMLLAGHTAAAGRDLPEYAASWRRYGLDMDVLDRSETLRITGSAKPFGGLLIGDAGTLNPVSYSRGLAAAAVSNGARVFERSTATSIDREGSRWRVRTKTGSVLASHVLIATGDYPATDSLWPGLSRTIWRMPAAMIASRPMPERIKEFMPAGIPIADASETNHFWLMATPDGRLSGSMFPPRHDAKSAAEVARPYDAKLRRIWGDFAPIEWEHFWIGYVAVTAKRLPCAFKLADNVVFIGGYSGQGITPATAAGREYANYIMADERESACLLPFLNPKPVPFRKLMPAIFRQVLVPTGQTFDRSYG